MLKPLIASLFVLAAFGAGIGAQWAGIPRAAKELVSPTPPDLSDGPWYGFKTAFERQFPVKADIVMVGDSLTESGDWKALFPNLSIANYGVSNDTTDGILRRLDTIKATDAKTAFIMAGVNDIRRNVPVEQITEKYRQIVTALRQSGMRVFVHSTLYTARPEETERIERLDAALAQLCGDGPCTFIDLNTVMAPNHFLPVQLTIDGTHLTATGYALWRNTLRPLLP